MSVRKKREDSEYIFFKDLVNRFPLTSKVMDDLLLNGFHKKVMTCYLK